MFQRAAWRHRARQGQNDLMRQVQGAQESSCAAGQVPVLRYEKTSAMPGAGALLMIIPFRSAMISGLLVVALTACSEDLPSVPPPLTPAAVEAAVARGEGTDPALYAGDFSVKAPFDIPAEKAPVPVVLYSGLSPEGETRLKIRSFVDLRQMQQQLPELLSGVVVDNCKHQFALDFTAADAQANDLRAWGTVNAKFFRCK